MKNAEQSSGADAPGPPDRDTVLDACAALEDIHVAAHALTRHFAESGALHDAAELNVLASAALAALARLHTYVISTRAAPSVTEAPRSTAGE